ncbi:uncharacterized protein LOC119172499 isoform X1 [Rhipicephalus microplus]|uniref:uncharacterized protein LOC119172499 isoform X1 n=1 Tax=Rhipicephalus microplus TaxID=6941 RepID=UPI003F6B4758
MASLQLPDYDETKDKWKPYLVRAEAYFEANSVTDPAKKRALLVSALSSKTVEVLAGRVAPRAPNELTYKEVVQSLNEYYDPKKHEITESYKFFNRSQLPGESVSAFLVAIRRIADNCNFGTSLDRMLRDRIVCGVRSVALRKQMLAKKDLTLEEAEALALSVEAAENGAESMTSEATPLLKLRASEANTVKTSPTRHAAQHCDRCGSSKHDGNSCRWIRARCYRCGRHGHLAKMCRTTASKSRVATHAVEGRALTLEEAVTEDDDKDETHIWTLLSARKSRLEPPIRRSFLWNGVQLTMEVDTGSPVCVISKNVFDKHREQWPALKPSQVKLSCYVGPLPVMGELQLCVQYRAVSVYCRLIVLNCSGPNLCGRDLISLLHRAGVPVLQPSAQDLLHSTPEPAGAVHNIVDDYHDVFSKDLGLIKGPPATLQLKEGAVPKFCRQFTLVTDHQPLLSLLQSDRPTPPLAAARIQRWALYLGGYRYKLQYTPGKQLLNADALSRLPLRSTEADDVGEPPEYVLALDNFDDGVITTRELQQLSATDPAVTAVKNCILHGWPKSAKQLEETMRPFFDRKLELSVAHGLVYWGHRVVIPEKARDRLLKLLHETHQGSSGMKAVARSKFWWPRLDRDIEALSAGCTNCAQNMPMPAAAPPVNWPKTNEKWSRLHVDFAGPIAGKMILVAVDAHTKWIEAVPVKHATTTSTITCLRAMFSRFGVPRTIVSDNGTQFSSQDFATFVAKNNIMHLKTAPFHPQSNGAAERAVRTIKDGLRKMREGNLEDNLVRLLFNYRRTPQKTGKSPSELLLGFQLRSRLDACFPSTVADSPPASDDWVVPIESNVYVRNYGVGEKWTPGRVQSTAGSRMVTVQTPHSVVRRHVDQVRPRQASQSPSPGSASLSESNMSMLPKRSPGPSTTSSTVLPPEALTTASPHDHPVPTMPQAGPTQAATPSAEPVLRRSTRQRKPVQRFHF